MDPLPLYAIAEYSYCPRSSYYVLTDTPKLNDENPYIQSGRHAHQKVDAGYTHSKGIKKVKASFRIYSDTLNIVGKVDFVEFFDDGRVIPVEIKRGKKRESRMHEIQLALIALCLQEMFPTATLEQGRIFFAEDRQKRDIFFTKNLLEEAESIALFVLDKAKKGLIPHDFPMQKDARCRGCCFYDLCYV